MNIDRIDTIIATRVLNHAQATEVVVRIGSPKQFEDSSDYYCPFQIIGLGDDKIRYAGGIDAIQAIQLTMKMIGIILYATAEFQRGDLSWEGGTESLGF